MELEFRNPDYIRPLGSSTHILSHPSTSDTIELGIFQEHRIAFFYWLRWTRDSGRTASLVSFDWHQDLCFPCETEKKWLIELDQSDNGQVAFFAWAKLAPGNDGHILAAAYLNLIGNVYVLCRQGTFEQDWEDEELVDDMGNKHLIRKFKTPEALYECLNDSNETDIYFDIDLDFFTIQNSLNGVGETFTYMTKKRILDILCVTNKLMSWINKRMRGFTIATEPEHCGGLLKSNKLLGIISEHFFFPDLFTQNCDWKHKYHDK